MFLSGLASNCFSYLHFRLTFSFNFSRNGFRWRKRIRNKLMDIYGRKQLTLSDVKQTFFSGNAISCFRLNWRIFCSSKYFNRNIHSWKYRMCQNLLTVLYCNFFMSTVYECLGGVLLRVITDLIMICRFVILFWAWRFTRQNSALFFYLWL